MFIYHCACTYAYRMFFLLSLPAASLRIVRRRKAGAALISAEQRQRIMDVAENLVEAGVAATPTAVCVELGDDTVPASAVIDILRHRRRTYGKSTRVLQESQATFESAVEKYKEEDGQQDLCLFKLKLKGSLPPWNSSRKEKQEKEHKEAKQADVVWMPLRADPVGSPQSPFWRLPSR